MVVKPHLLSHWKLKTFTLKLKIFDPQMPENLRGSLALTTLLRLWFHCETSRVWAFKKMGPEMLAAVCEWPFDPAWLYGTLQECGWIKVKRGLLIVHDWQIHNAQLIASWERAQYGNLGGRPPQTLKVPLKKPSKVRVVRKEDNPSKPSLHREGGGSAASPGAGAPAGQNPNGADPPRAELLRRVERLLGVPELGGLGRAEEKAWARCCDAVAATTPRQWEALEAYYGAEEHEDTRFRRQKVTSVLLHWEGEVAIALKFWKKQKEAAAAEAEQWPAFEGWHELLGSAYPESVLPTDWGELPESMKEAAYECRRKAK